METDVRGRGQARVDRIAWFREELAELEAEQGLLLTTEQRDRLEAHHERVLAELARRFDVDATESTRRASWGMRIAALLGIAALGASLVLFLHRVWGYLPLAAQLLVLVVPPLALLAAALATHRRRVATYYTALLATAATVSFIAESSVLGSVLGIVPSPHAVLAWGVFALLVAGAFGVRWLMAGGLILIAVYSAAVWVDLAGAAWEAFPGRARTLIPAAALFYAAAILRPGPSAGNLQATLRSCGAGVGLMALFIESVSGHLDLGLVSRSLSVAVAQMTGLVAGAAVVGHGLRLGQRGLVNLGAIAFVVFLYARLHAWWWEWMPKYLFFLAVGSLAFGLVLVFRRLRSLERRRAFA